MQNEKLKKQNKKTKKKKPTTTKKRIQRENAAPRKLIIKKNINVIKILQSALSETCVKTKF